MAAGEGRKGATCTLSRLGCRQAGVAPLSISRARTPSAKSDGPETMRWLSRKSVRSTSARLRPRPCRSALKDTFWDSGEPLHAWYRQELESMFWIVKGQFQWHQKQPVIFRHQSTRHNTALSLPQGCRNTTVVSPYFGCCLIEFWW